MMSRIQHYRDLVGVAAYDDTARADALAYWRTINLSASRYQPLIFLAAFALPAAGYFTFSLPWWICLGVFLILGWIASNASRNYGVSDSVVKLMEGRATEADIIFLDAHGFNLSGWFPSVDNLSNE